MHYKFSCITNFVVVKGTIEIIGSIGASLIEGKKEGITLQDVVSKVRALGEVDEIQVDIATPGGIEQVSDEIHKYLRSLGKKIITNQVGLIASAGVKIFLAGDERIGDPTKPFIIHNTHLKVDAPIDVNTSEKITTVLRESRENLLKFYAEKTGNTLEALRPLMDDETSINDNLVGLGFATKINESFFPGL